MNETQAKAVKAALDRVQKTIAFLRSQVDKHQTNLRIESKKLADAERERDLLSEPIDRKVDA